MRVIRSAAAVNGLFDLTPSINGTEKDKEFGKDGLKSQPLQKGKKNNHNHM
jgi:hypothetical protein